MRVNVAVSGRFHYHNYVRYLQESGVLNCFYYSHKLASNSDSLGVPEDKLVNVWIKEYLLQLHSRLPALFNVEGFKPMYRAIWACGALRHWKQADILHIMLHGGGRSLIKRTHYDNSFAIGEPVNAHPDMQNSLLEAEYDRLKIRRHSKRTYAQSLIIEEVGMVDRLLVASHFLKKSYVEHGYPSDSIDVLPYGVDFSKFNISVNREFIPKKFTVICVAGISIRKGIIDLLKAWEKFGPSRGELILIGRISNEMVDTVRRYQSIFTHVPFVPNHELINYFEKASVFVLPSIEDGFGLVCSEAMACGLPVIATTNTGAAELIEDDVDGYVVPIRSPEIIAEKLELMFNDREKTYEMGCNAADKVKQLHGWPGYAKELIGLYHKYYK